MPTKACAGDVPCFFFYITVLLRHTRWHHSDRDPQQGDLPSAGKERNRASRLEECLHRSVGAPLSLCDIVCVCLAALEMGRGNTKQQVFPCSVFLSWQTRECHQVRLQPSLPHLSLPAQNLRHQKNAEQINVKSLPADNTEPSTAALHPPTCCSWKTVKYQSIFYIRVPERILQEVLKIQSHHCNEQRIIPTMDKQRSQKNQQNLVGDSTSLSEIRVDVDN